MMLNRYARNKPIAGTGTYPDNADKQASEDNWRNPSPLLLTDADYRAMLAQSYGQTAAVLSSIQNLIDLAADRSQIVMVNGSNFATDMPVPQGDMRSVIIPRPSLSEQTSAGSFSDQLQITFDTGLSYPLVNPGVNAAPIISGTKTYRVHVKATNADTPPAGWAIFLLFRNAQYNPGANL